MVKPWTIYDFLLILILFLFLSIVLLQMNILLILSLQTDRDCFYNVKIFMIKSQLKCPCCNALFGFENTPKILKNCTHTICINCLKILKNCPIDSTEINTTKWGIKNFLTNTEILQKLQKQQDTIIQSKKYDRRFTFGLQQENFAIQEFRQTQKQSNWKFCNKHLTKANFIEKQNGRFICRSCIEEKDLKRYDLLEYDELVKFMTTFTDQAYKIFDKIKAKSQNLTKNKIHELISCQINKKKEKQVYHIKSFFQKLFEKLRKQEKILLQNLQQKAKLYIQNLQQTFQFREIEIKNQCFRTEIHKLTTVMDQVYNYEGIQKALLYLNQSKQDNQLIRKGNKICQELSQIEERIQQKVKQTSSDLQYCLHDKNIEVLSNRSCRVSENFTISSTFHLKIYQNQKDQNYIKSSHVQTDIEVQTQSKSESHQQEFLLESMNDDIEKNEGFTKNQITFEQHFSLIAPDSYQEEQFTPILRKEEDSLAINTITEETTILNSKSSQNCTISQLQSQQPTIIQIQKRENHFLSDFTKTSKIRLQKTQIKDHSRSPLTPLRNGSLSKLKRHQIPEKYVPIWEAAKKDRISNVDLTGAELGDTLILHLGSFLSKSQKIKSLKLIRNKLTDEVVFDLINFLTQTNICSINLSQNSLTEKSLDTLEGMELGKLKSITLSQNKIVLRKVKDRIQRFKQKGITLTV